MPTFTAGSALIGANTRRALPLVGMVDSDLTVVNLDVPVDAPGLVVQLDAFVNYAVDGFIAYSSLSTSADLKLRLRTPTGAGGSWFPAGVTASSTSATGDAEYLRFGLADSAGLVGGTSPVAGCFVQGFVSTFTFPGPLQVQFAQVVSNAAILTIRPGSWIRATPIA